VLSLDKTMTSLLVGVSIIGLAAGHIRQCLPGLVEGNLLIDNWADCCGVNQLSNLADSQGIRVGAVAPGAAAAKSQATGYLVPKFRVDGGGCYRNKPTIYTIFFTQSVTFA